MRSAISKKANSAGLCRHFGIRAFLRETEHAILLGVSPESVSGREKGTLSVAALKAKVAPDDKIMRIL